MQNSQLDDINYLLGNPALNISRYEKLLILQLSRYMDKNYISVPNLMEIKVYLGINYTTIDRLLNSLIKKNHISLFSFQKNQSYVDNAYYVSILKQIEEELKTYPFLR